MDLRILKTKKNIADAFLKLRKKNPLEKIKVSELCKIAFINKTTFYNHYEDIFALSEELEDEIVEKIIKSEHIRSLFSDPKSFVTSVFNTAAPLESVITVLFDGRMNILVSKIEDKLKTIYFAEKITPGQAMTLSFCIGGAVHLILKPEYDQGIVIDTLVKIILSIAKNAPV